MRQDEGSGAVLAVGIVAVLLCLASLISPLYIGLLAKQRAASAADNAALAGADVAIGILPGASCDAARLVAEAGGAALDVCRADGVVITVRVSMVVLGLGVSASATAGPPGAE